MLQRNYDNGESSIRPNGRSYSSVASAYIKTGRPDSVAQAERLLSLAEERGLARVFVFIQFSVGCLGYEWSL
jgi:hypothetical protein